MKSNTINLSSIDLNRLTDYFNISDLRLHDPPSDPYQYILRFTKVHATLRLDGSVQFSSLGSRNRSLKEIYSCCYNDLGISIIEFLTYLAQLGIDKKVYFCVCPDINRLVMIKGTLPVNHLAFTDVLMRANGIGSRSFIAKIIERIQTEILTTNSK